MDASYIDEDYEVYFDKEFSQHLLDTYQKLTTLAISLKINGLEEPLYSKNYWPKFCNEIRQEFSHICRGVFSDQEELHMCKAGLWCRNIKIKIEGRSIGTLAVGHRLIVDRMAESENQLIETLSKETASEDKRKKLVNLLKEVCIVNEQQFDYDILKDFSIIEQYLMMERKRAFKTEKQLMDIKETAANISHQLIMPMQAIVADLRNLSLDTNKPDYSREQLKKDINEVLNKVCKLSYSAENLRNFISQEAETHRYEFRNMNIEPLLAEAINLFKSEAKQKNIMIKGPTFKTVPFPEAWISEPHIKSVFYNLMNNAVKYAFRGSREEKNFITVICSPDSIKGKSGFIIEISNLGVGIEEDEIRDGKIFELGYRGRLTRDESRIGSGLGLYYVKKVITDHGGNIFINSEIRGIREIGRVTAPYLTTVKLFLPKKGPGERKYGEYFMGRR